MGKKLKIGSGGLSLEADLADAFFIMSEPLGKESEIGKLNVDIEESTKLYDVMGYTTDIGTLALIFQNKTFPLFFSLLYLHLFVHLRNFTSFFVIINSYIILNISIFHLSLVPTLSHNPSLIFLVDSLFAYIPHTLIHIAPVDSYLRNSRQKPV